MTKQNNDEISEILFQYLQDHSKAQAHDRLQEHNNADKRAKASLDALINKRVVEARIDEVLKMRAVGDQVAAKPGSNFEELSGAYDAHILKRAADLTSPKANNEDKDR